MPVRIVSAPAEVQTGHFSKAGQKRYRLMPKAHVDSAVRFLLVPYKDQWVNIVLRSEVFTAVQMTHAFQTGIWLN
jgi:hypothetical protein